MMHIDKFIQYITVQRRFAERTQQIYRDVLTRYEAFTEGALSPIAIRSYEVHLMDECKESPRTVSQHMSVLSSYCRFLMKEGLAESNPVRLVKRPKQEKRLPEFYREESMKDYFDTHRGTLEFGSYEAALNYMIVSLLFSTGMRRSELISLDNSSVDFARRVIRVHGKGDKTRDIPIPELLCSEISMYQDSKDAGMPLGPSDPLLLTPKGGRLYPVFVDRVIKKELGSVGSITSRRSPHVLRHTLATELLDSGTDLNSIKEMLGHSSLAATQVYTHNSIEKLQSVYRAAHPRSGSKK